MLTKHTGAFQTSQLPELARREALNLALDDCHFSDLCPNLKQYTFKNSSLQHVYLEALKFYYRREWQAANSSLEKMIRFVKDFNPANNLKKRISNDLAVCPADWVSHLLIDLDG